MRLEDCQDVAKASDMRTLESRLVRFANDLGFGIISGAVILEHGAGRVTTLPFGNTSEAYKPTADSVERGKRDPVMHRLKRLSVPFVYDQRMYVEEQAGDIWETQAAYGYKTGIATALHLPQGRHFLLGVDRDEPLPRDNSLLERMMADFHLFAAHAQLPVLRLILPQESEVPNAARFTERETEILKWTAEGKSAWAVGQILGISEHTVNYHIQKTLSKLSVGSKHQAAAKARSIGLI